MKQMHYKQPNQHYGQPNHQQHYPQAFKEDPRMTKLRQDNMMLQKALTQLNECYSQKISLLQQELKASKQREQALLEWKSSYIDKELFNNSKYEKQLQKLLSMIEDITKNYEQNQDQLNNQLEQKEQQINQLQTQNIYLKQQKQTQELQISTLAHKYIEEIQRLNNQLKQLKDQISYQDSNDKSIQNQESNQGHNQEPNQQILTPKDSIHINFQPEQLHEQLQESINVQTNFPQDTQISTQSPIQENPLRDISNKKPLKLQSSNKPQSTSKPQSTNRPQSTNKTTFMNGAITIQTQFNH